MVPLAQTSMPHYTVHDDLNEMLTGKPHRANIMALIIWKKVGPLSLKSIREQSNELLSVDTRNVHYNEWIEVKEDNRTWILCGTVNDKGEKHGIVRTIRESDGGINES